MKLLFYELSKFFLKKKVLLVILLFLLLNPVLFFFQNRTLYESHSATKAISEQLQAQLEGLSTEEALEKLTALCDDANNLAGYLRMQQAGDDPMILSLRTMWLEEHADLLETYAGTPFLTVDGYAQDYSTAAVKIQMQLQYIQEYPDFIRSVRTNAEKMLKMSMFNKKGTFAYNNILKTPDAFAPLENQPLRIGPEMGVNLGCSFRLTDLFLLASLFLLCLYLFLHEEDTGLIRLVRTARLGRGATAAAKLSAVALVSMLLALLFHGSLLLLSGQLFGFGDLSRPIQSLSSFQNCTLPLSVGEYLVVFLLLKMGAALLCAWIMSLIFLLFRSIRSIFVVLCVFFGLSALCYYTITPTSWLSLLKYINLFSFLDPYELLRRYANLNFFSLAWNRLSLSLILGGVLLVLLPLLAALVYLQNRSVPFVDTLLRRFSAFVARLRRRQPLRGQTSLFGHELRKVIITGRAWIFLLVALLLCLKTIKPEPLVIYDSTTAVYQSYIDRWSGPVTPETKRAIEAERQRIDAMSQELDTLKAQYEAGEIDTLTYEMGFQRTSQDIQVYSAAFERLDSAYQASLAMEAETGYPAAIVSDISASYLFDNSSRDLLQGLLLVFLIILTLSAVFSIDTERGIDPILRCTVKGRGRRLRIQLLCCSLLIVFLWICSYAPLIPQMTTNYPLPLDVAVQNLSRYRDIPFALSLRGYLCIAALGTLLACFCSGILTLLLAQFVRKQGFCILISGALLLLPFLAFFLGIPLLARFSLLNAFIPFSISGGEYVAWLIYLGIMLLVTAAGVRFLHFRTR